MMLSSQVFKTLYEVKDIIIERKAKTTNEEYLKLNEVYSEITGRPINRGCDGCMSTVYQILNNWIDKFFEVQKALDTTTKIVERIRTRKPKA